MAAPMIVDGWMKSIGDTKVLDDFKTDHFVQKESQKYAILLHQTFGSTARSSFSWLQTSYGTVMVHFFVDTDGSIHQCIPLHYWAYHVGKGPSSVWNVRTVSIEIANMGPLQRIGDSLFTLYNSKVPYMHVKDTDRYTAVTPYYRDYGYFVTHPQKQLDAVRLLVHTLADYFNIPKVLCPRMWEFDPSFRANFNGVLHHGKLRPDKLDLSPAYPVETLGLEGNWKWPV